MKDFNQYFVSTSEVDFIPPSAYRAKEPVDCEVKSVVSIVDDAAQSLLKQGYEKVSFTFTISKRERRAKMVIKVNYAEFCAQKSRIMSKLTNVTKPAMLLVHAEGDKKAPKSLSYRIKPEYEDFGD